MLQIASNPLRLRCLLLSRTKVFWKVNLIVQVREKTVFFRAQIKT